MIKLRPSTFLASVAIVAVLVAALMHWTRPSPAYAQTGLTVSTVADITGDGSVHALPLSGTARWVQIVASTSNAAAVRIGDSNISSSRGIPVAAGAGYLLPASNYALGNYYNLASIYYLAQSGDKISVEWGQ